MIIGTGIDIIEVSRIKKALDIWGDKFLNRVFTKRELSYANFTNRHCQFVKFFEARDDYRNWD